ncbi:MAG: hypothetical protein J2O48_12175 [Solirubrobacterales bacterium]|nr:hypothetical protein [Solirubrobacterales bacterium]
MNGRNALTAAAVTAGLAVAGCGGGSSTNSSSSGKSSSAAQYRAQLQSACKSMSSLTPKVAQIQKGKGSQGQKVAQLLKDMQPYVTKMAAIQPPSNFKQGTAMHSALTSYSAALPKAEKQLSGAKSTSQMQTAMTALLPLGQKLTTSMKAVGATGCANAGTAG